MNDLEKSRRELQILLELAIMRMRRDRRLLMINDLKYGSILLVLLAGLIAFEILVVQPYFKAHP